MKIIVFGGSGFLGSHVCDKLSDAGHEVTIFDRIESPWLGTDQKMVVGDILDEQHVYQVVEGAQVVFNFAGIADMEDALNKPMDTVRYNVLGNTVILEACRIAKVERYVFASTVYVYSKSGGFYRCSKQACELYIENYHEVYGLNYTILRYGSLYGPRSDFRNGVYRIIHRALSEEKILYHGSPDSVREYIHVDDAARSSVEILKVAFQNQHVVLTGHQPMRVHDLLKMISEMLGNTMEPEYITLEQAGHYEMTPYSFNPKIGLKYSPPSHVDMGQGLLRVIEEIHHVLHEKRETHFGWLMKNSKNQLQSKES